MRRSLNRGVWLLFLLVISVTGQARSLPDFVDLVKANSPAVVNISTTRKASVGHPWGNIEIPEDAPFGDLFRHFFGDQGSPLPQPDMDVRSLGSGFIISADGYVITNYHVVEDADEILVRLSDKRELNAKVIGSDKSTDIALLKIDSDHLPVVSIGNSENSQVGEWVLAIGSPFGFDHSVTAGIISAKGRSLPKANYVPFIQTDVAINPGNSGGPLFNMDGKVIGINSQIYSRTGGFMGLSFAIPIEVAMDVVKQIKEKGSVSRGWLGVYIQEVTLELAESFGLDKPVGALVSQVIPDSPAEKAGIKAGDIILSFNDEKIQNSSDLPPLVGRMPLGSDVKVRVLRDRKYKTLTVHIEQLPEEEPVMAKQPAVSSRIGVEVTALDDAERKRFGHGVRITDVAPGSVGQRAGLRTGDVILQMNRKDVKDVADFRARLAQLEEGRLVPILVRRQGADQFLVLKIPKS